MKRSNFRAWIGASWIAVLLGAVFCISPACAAQTGDRDASSKSDLRDPFWPVGFYPQGWGRKDLEKVQKEEHETNNAWKKAFEQVTIKGVSKLNQRRVAFINGKLKSVGDIVAVRVGGAEYKGEIKKINTDGTVEFAKIKSVSQNNQPESITPKEED